MQADRALCDVVALPQLGTVSLASLCLHTTAYAPMEPLAVEGFLAGLSKLGVQHIEDEHLRWVYDPAKGQQKPPFPEHLLDVLQADLRQYSEEYFHMIQKAGSLTIAIEERRAIGLNADMNTWLDGFVLAIEVFGYDKLVTRIQ